MVNIPDKDDLEALKLEIITTLLEKLPERINIQDPVPVRWLRGREVKQMLGDISETTLQNLRIEGLQSSKVLGTHYYLLSDVITFMENHK